MLNAPRKKLFTPLGYIAITIFCLTTAISAIMVHFSFAAISGTALTFVTFIVAFSIFMLCRIGHINQLIILLKHHPLKIGVLNLYTLLSWWFMFMALQKIEPSVEAAIYMGWIPVAVFIFDLLQGNANLLSKRLGAAVIISILIFCLVIARASSNLPGIADNTLISGIVLASAAGLAGGAYISASSQLHSNGGYHALDLLCIRFILLLLVTGWIGRDALAEVFTLEPLLLLELVGFSIISVVIPTFTLQLALQHLNSTLVSLIIPIIPVLALCGEIIIQRSVLPSVAVLIIAITGAIFFSIISKK